MSEEFKEKTWCYDCKDLIENNQKSITVIEDGVVKEYHKFCYDLLHPPENGELNFG